MLDKTRIKLASMYDCEPQRGYKGKYYTPDAITRITWQQGEIIANLHRDMKPELSVEIGFAYGFSTLFILDAMYESKYGHHIAIDPFERSWGWAGVGERAVKELGFSRRFRWIQERSAFALSKMLRDKRRTQFVYIDGYHTFEGCLMDFCGTDHVLDIGGLVIIDDMWMPSIRRVVDFISTNMRHFEHVDTDCSNIRVFRKTAADSRSWDHFVEFYAPARPAEPEIVDAS